MKYVIIISGPSGVGKSTIIRYILQKFPEVKLSVSCTTRSPRAMEQNGREYYFISEDEFKNALERDAFVEYTHCFGNYYGTPKRGIKRILENSGKCLLDIEFQGAENILKHNVLDPEGKEGIKKIGILLLPPSLEALKKRLLTRGSETQEAYETRLKSFDEQSINKYKNLFKYIVVNHSLSTAQRQILQILHEEFNSLAE